MCMRTALWIFGCIPICHRNALWLSPSLCLYIHLFFFLYFFGRSKGPSSGVGGLLEVSSHWRWASSWLLPLLGFLVFLGISRCCCQGASTRLWMWFSSFWIMVWLIDWWISSMPSCTCCVQRLAQRALLRVRPLCVGSSWVLQLPPPAPNTPRTWCNSGCSLEWECVVCLFFNVALSFTWRLVQSPAPPGIGSGAPCNPECRRRGSKKIKWKVKQVLPVHSSNSWQGFY